MTPFIYLSRKLDLKTSLLSAIISLCVVHVCGPVCPHIWEVARGQRKEESISQQIYFRVSNDSAIALGYIDLNSSVVRRLQQVNSCLRVAKRAETCSN
jgi:hypothetical protein